MSDKKDRLQFYINPEANKQLDYVSEKMNVSKAELVRQGVDKILKEKLPVNDDPAYKLIGLIDNEVENIKKKNYKYNIAENHDYYLYEKGQLSDEQNHK